MLQTFCFNLTLVELMVLISVKKNVISGAPQEIPHGGGLRTMPRAGGPDVSDMSLSPSIPSKLNVSSLGPS